MWASRASRPSHAAWPRRMSSRPIAAVVACGRDARQRCFGPTGSAAQASRLTACLVAVVVGLTFAVLVLYARARWQGLRRAPSPMVYGVVERAAGLCSSSPISVRVCWPLWHDRSSPQPAAQGALRDTALRRQPRHRHRARAQQPRHHPRSNCFRVLLHLSSSVLAPGSDLRPFHLPRGGCNYPDRGGARSRAVAASATTGPRVLGEGPGAL